MTQQVRDTMPDEQRLRQRDDGRDGEEQQQGQPRQEDPQAEDIRPGMVVETTEGDLGEQDVSRPRVKEVMRGEDGHVRDVVVEKGVVFKKDLDVPAERIEAVTPPEDCEDGCGEVVVETREPEVEALKPAGTETLPPLAGRPQDASDTGDILSEAEERLPTAEGQRRNEGEATEQRREDVATGEAEQVHAEPAHFSLRMLGPGLLAGMSGNDATAVGAYAVNGATAGLSQLWLMLLSTPMYQAVIYACGKIGRISGQGFTEVLRAHHGRKAAVPIALVLLAANVALIVGDLVAVGSGLELLTGINWAWFVLPVAAALWYITVFQNFGVIKRVFLGMSLVFVAYLITGFFSGANWGAVLANTFVPRLGFDFASISAAVALLGATLSPYTMFWQVQAEKEQVRPGTPRQQTRLAALDIATGTVGGNLVSYFIILTTATTLFVHHQQINTAADAARALEPLLGPFAKYLFAIGFIGAGIVAIPVLLASTSYALAGALGWSASLWRKPWQAEGFYLIMTGALAASALLALVRVNPIQLIFWANILQAVLAPILMVTILILGNSRRIMKDYRLGWLTNAWVGFAVLVTVAGAVLLAWGLATGQGG